jgi:hypothetical protein
MSVISMNAESQPSVEALLHRQAVYEQMIRSLTEQVTALRKQIAANANADVDWTPVLERLSRPFDTFKGNPVSDAACDRILAYNRGRISFEEFVGEKAKE